MPWDACNCEKWDGDFDMKYEAVRSILQIPSTFGMPCPEVKQTRQCEMKKKCAQPVDCEMGAWGPWEDCSAKCDGGVQSRNRNRLHDVQYTSCWSFSYQ